MERIEKSINKFVRLWFGLSKSLTDIALYSKQVPCPLPLTSLVAMYKSTKVNSHLQLRYSADKEVSVNARKPDCGRKWDVEAAVDRAESRILNEKLLGAVRKGRAGLGLFPSVNIATVGTREYRRHVVAKTMDEHEDKYLERAVQQSIQGKWTQWQDFVSRDIKWRSLYSAELKLAKFCIGATYNTFGTPANLKRWGFVSIASCALCDAEVCGIQHILSGCKTMLAQGRYTYRHNNVLRVIAHGIESFFNTNTTFFSGNTQIRFIKETRPDQKPENKTSAKIKAAPVIGILHKAKDWVLDVDLENKLVFPPRIVADVTLRPDMVLFSESTRVVVLIELTSPCEENFEARHIDKMNRYGDLVDQCVSNGWHAHCFAVEVGALLLRLRTAYGSLGSQIVELRVCLRRRRIRLSGVPFGFTFAEIVLIG